MLISVLFRKRIYVIPYLYMFFYVHFCPYSRREQIQGEGRNRFSLAIVAVSIVHIMHRYSKFTQNIQEDTNERRLLLEKLYLTRRTSARAVVCVILDIKNIHIFISLYVNNRFQQHSCEENIFFKCPLIICTHMPNDVAIMSFHVILCNFNI